MMKTGTDSGRGSGGGARLIVVTEVRLLRDATLSALSATTNFLVVACCPTELPFQVQRLRPHVVLFDFALTSLNCLIGHAKCVPETKVLVFGINDDYSRLLGCVRAGATGFLCGSACGVDLTEAIEKMLSGQSVCSPDIAERLFAELANEKTRVDATGLNDLTRREREVWKLVAQGKSNKEIGVALNIAESTVKHHVHHLLEKLHVTTRNQATIRALGHPLDDTAAESSIMLRRVVDLAT